MAKLLSKRSSGGGNLRDGGGHKRRRNIRPSVRVDRGHAAELTKEAMTMPERSEIELIRVVRDLLREGRVSEADKQLDSMQEDTRREAERKKRELPPPAKRTLAELQIDFAQQV